MRIRLDRLNANGFVLLSSGSVLPLGFLIQPLDIDLHRLYRMAQYNGRRREMLHSVTTREQSRRGNLQNHLLLQRVSSRPSHFPRTTFKRRLITCLLLHFCCRYFTKRGITSFYPFIEVRPILSRVATNVLPP